jgi:hypothetical protein
LPRDRYPETAKHTEDAQAAGHPDVVTLDRGSRAKKRRKESLAGGATAPEKDRDEYPPAMTKEGGQGASVRHVPYGDNRGAGSCVALQCKQYPNGTRVRIRVVDSIPE